MKTTYRGFEIEAKRQQCLAGYPLLYFSVCRNADGWFLEDSFSEGSDTVREMVGYLKKRVDGFYQNPADEEPPELQDVFAETTNWKIGADGMVRVPMRCHAKRKP